MLKEIGSNFWLDINGNYSLREINLSFLRGKIRDMALLSTGRGAISYILKHINSEADEKTALLPSFTCHSVIKPFLDGGYQVAFYDVDKQLECDVDVLLDKIKRIKPRVVLFHGYFGFNTLHNIESIITEIKNNNVVVIEDITQSLYSNFPHLDADYYIASLRKWGPLPDGALAASVNAGFKDKPAGYDHKLLEVKLEALHQKHLYMNKGKGNKDYFLYLFKTAENILGKQKGLYAMSGFSQKVQANMDYELIREKRRSNYKKLLCLIKPIKFLKPIFAHLPDPVTPLYFPIYVTARRQTIQGYLAENDIYCPVIWPKTAYCDKVSNTVDWIYEHILAIPCDQRYGKKDMERIGQTLLNIGSY